VTLEALIVDQVGFAARIVGFPAGVRLRRGYAARNNLLAADYLPIPAAIVTVRHDAKLDIAPYRSHGQVSLWRAMQESPANDVVGLLAERYATYAAL
jgi:hypothetical protein